MLCDPVLQVETGNEVKKKDENVINHTLKYLYSAFGDFTFELNGTPVMRLLHAAYVMMSNLLLVNLIIAMMGTIRLFFSMRVPCHCLRTSA
jgi:hypothetical protein